MVSHYSLICLFGYNTEIHVLIFSFDFQYVSVCHRPTHLACHAIGSTAAVVILFGEINLHFNLAYCPQEIPEGLSNVIVQVKLFCIFDGFKFCLFQYLHISLTPLFILLVPYFYIYELISWLPRHPQYTFALYPY